MASGGYLEQAIVLLDLLTDVDGDEACDGPNEKLCTVHGNNLRGGEDRDTTGRCPHRRAHELLEELEMR